MKHLLFFVGNIFSFSGRILYLNLLGMILIGLLEGIGILLLVPFIKYTGVLNVGLENKSQVPWIDNIFDSIPQEIRLAIILAIYVGIIIGHSFFQRNQTILNTQIQQKFLSHLRNETYKVLMQTNWGFYLKNRKSDIINVMTTEIIRVSSGTNLFLNFVAALVFTLIQVTISFWLSPIMTITVLIFGFVLIFFSKRFIKKSSKIGEETILLSKIYMAGISDHFNGIKDIKSNSLEESHIDWMQSFSLKFEKNVVNLIKLKTKSQLIFKVVSAFLIAGFVYFSVKMFQAQPAQVMLIVVIFTRIWPRLSGIQSNLEQLGEIEPSFKYLISIQEECKKAKEIHGNENTNISAIKIKKGLQFLDVTFRYNIDQSLYTLKDINLKIPTNKMTAVVGRSGAGKSTLIDLLMGLNKPEEGQILIDGIPVKGENLLPLRRSISYVPQDPFLFNGSIRENLLMIEPHATDEQLWKALEFSSAAEFVSGLPKGLDTLIGDRGIRLSGGERQRLVFARAILRKPSILVLDEATSALDSDNEAKIQAALEKLKGEMTIVVIAHRLSTIKNADQVIVLDQGRIIQQGGYNQLASDKEGIFNHLLEQQMNAV
ncbi:ABC transporter ATP-binding protein [Mesobacillus foraminis]|uniref:ATP-binding cassette subfamily C protein n=1 Tax=Mesobacillus foraminis TaxID=279826 RepID=A0A4V2RCT6_9BACI|nr:ABC transporter ATP-binding protein [Mesobacillus foraminis]TCN22180.1 ATP-binding cassette subfamily C protein [Mesobacillus foraminis]